MQDRKDLPKDAAAVLKRVGRVPGASGPLERLTIVIAMLAISAAALSAALALSDTAGEAYGKAVSAAAGGIAFIYAYLQWRAGRHEASYDRYYDRLEISNRRFDALRVEQLKGDARGTTDHLRTMFIFAELDSLEYILGKYRLRYVRPELACRAIRAFAARCEDPQSGKEFGKEAADWTMRPGTSYQPYTKAAVEMLAGSAS